MSEPKEERVYAERVSSEFDAGQIAAGLAFEEAIRIADEQAKKIVPGVPPEDLACGTHVWLVTVAQNLKIQSIPMTFILGGAQGWSKDCNMSEFDRGFECETQYLAVKMYDQYGFGKRVWRKVEEK